VQVLQGKTEKSRVLQKNEMPHKQQRKRNTLGKVPSDYTKKIGAGLYEKQNAYFAHFQKRPSIFSYFSHNIQQVPMGFIIRK
jgi:hypothetical protein